MPSFNHLVETDYHSTFRTEKVVGMFDVPIGKKITKSWQVSIPIEGIDWSVGLIVGASGSGKTTIAKEAFKDCCFFNGHKWGSTSMLNDFDQSLSIKDITDALSHVGFSSPPSWLLPCHCLSNGQKFRADLARAVLETSGVLVFDEFTSLVDRTVAKIGSHAVQKFIRKVGRKFIAVTCHYDVAEWLEPDWIYDVSTMSFSMVRLRRPEISIEIQRVHYSAWKIFKGHHYLNAELNNAARVFVATVEGQPVAMTAILAFPHPKLKNAWKEHRTVVLPDYQGIGLGNKISEHVGDLLLSDGKSFISVTSYPAMIHHRAKSLKWRTVRLPGHISKSNGKKNTKSSNSRITASFKYIGSAEAR